MSASRRPTSATNLTAEQAGETTHRMERRLRKAVRRGDISRQERYLLDLLDGLAPRFVAAMNSERLENRRRKRMGMPPYRPSDAERQSMAEQIDPYTRLNEPMRHFTEQKPGGGIRHLYSFGPLARAAQALAARAMRSATQPPAFIFDARRQGVDDHQRGRNEAIRAVLSEVAEELEPGTPLYEFAIVADVKDCFDSVNRHTLPSLLPLPPEVTRKVVLCEDQPVHGPRRARSRYRPSRRNNPREGGRRPSGVPQGAVTSCVVMSLLFADMDTAVPDWVPLFVFRDDVVALATSRLEAESIASTLQSYFGSHPAGPFDLKTLEVRPIDEGFEFLGYDIMRNGPVVDVNVSFKSHGRLSAWIAAEVSRPGRCC